MSVHTRRPDLKWYHLVLLYGVLAIVIGGLVAILWPRAARAQSPSPPSISQVSSESVTIGQLLSVIAERDRQYTQRFDAQEKALSFALVNLNQRFDAQEKSTTVALAAAERAVQAALIAAKEAVQKAENAAEKRFDSVNEFRNTLRDQQLLLMTRAEGDAKFRDTERRLSEITENLNRRASEQKGAGDLWSIIVAGVGFLMMLIGGYVALNPRRPMTAKT